MANNIRMIPFLYVYDEVTGRLSSYRNLYFKRLTIQENTPKEREICVAAYGLKTLQFKIAERQENVYYDPDQQIYTIWLNHAPIIHAIQVLKEAVAANNNNQIKKLKQKITLLEQNIERSKRISTSPK